MDGTRDGSGWLYPDHKAANNIMGQPQRRARQGKLLEALSRPCSTPRLHTELFHIIKHAYFVPGCCRLSLHRAGLQSNCFTKAGVSTVAG